MQATLVPPTTETVLQTMQVSHYHFLSNYHSYPNTCPFADPLHQPLQQYTQPLSEDPPVHPLSSQQQLAQGLTAAVSRQAFLILVE